MQALTVVNYKTASANQVLLVAVFMARLRTGCVCHAGALQLVYRVNKMRGHHCVYQAAKLAVEQQCGRRFLVRQELCDKLHQCFACK